MIRSDRRKAYSFSSICPWYLLGSAGIFVTFISSYQIFLFSIIGVLLVDYYIISKGRLDLTWMYTADKHGPYCMLLSFE